MKGLLIKDFYTLFKQMKSMLLLIVIFCIFPGSSLSVFAIMYSAMLPITALAYDEKSKWNLLASMMPYSNKDIILSKYYLGYIAVGAVSALSFVAQVISSIIKHRPITKDDIVPIIVMALFSTILLSINMPIMMKYGVEKGRLAFIIMIVLIVSAVTAINSVYAYKNTEIYEKLESIDISLIMLLAFAIVVFNYVSIKLSIKFKKK